MDLKKPFPVPVVSAAAARRAEDPWYAEPQSPVPGVRDVVLVGSGKGGVGKSTVTVNLACALAAQGLRVGVADADLYGPSVARLLGTGAGLAHGEDGRTVPALAHGVHAVSVANILPPEAALAWKGPLVAQALLQLFHEVAWPDLDLLLVDLPPGTGDVQLTLLEQVPVSGALLVTTPQRLALADAERGIALFHELDIPVFGLVENMSHYVCPCCGEHQPLFPEGGVRDLAARRHVSYLGSVPLDPAGQALADGGTPLVAAQPEAAAAQAFIAMAERLRAAVELERRALDRSPEAGGREAHAAFWEQLLD
ncbi:P-loop NTPase [Thioalbus denitrificans]|uniref:Iron-sulfur cluster carrier protein n=1 Tax=Thioalbus denitrificans TaxID=547122 RepID=A0A369BS37_9GAMM|nr:P-loop NTPase [Thioalbus denitrificans]RCX22414.1 ATP-binding protein involved in chromosome partitioning [Thioalbus denitrificans]